MHQPSHRRRRTLGAAALLLTPAPAALATTIDWLPTAPTPAPFSDPANWSTGTAPTAADAAQFATGSAHTVTLTADTTTNQLLIANDALTLDLAGRTYTLANLTSTSPGISLGAPTTSSLALLNSSSSTPATLTAVQLVMSSNPGDTSSLSLTANTALVGYSVAGTAYPSFSFAKSGSAAVSLSDGARLDTSAGSAWLGQEAGSSASLSLTGPATRWTTGTTSVGLRGNASVLITGGAAMAAPSFPVYVGNDSAAHTASGSITVDGPGSPLNATNLYIGYQSRGSLAVCNGASVSVSSTLAVAGSFAKSVGSLTLDGDTSSITVSNLNVGSSSSLQPIGTATVDIRSGTLAAYTVTLPAPGGTSATALNLSGGTLKLDHFTTDPNTGRAPDLSRLHWTGGTLELTNSAFQVSNPTTSSPALNYIASPGPSLSLSGGMALKLSSPPGHLNYLVVDNGGTLSADNASISASDVAWIGYAATGALALTNHASMSSPGGTIGYEIVAGGTAQFGSGTATLDDHASWSLTGNLDVGGFGGGTLAVRGASAVSNLNATIAAGPIASSATVDGPGSSWSSSGTLTVGKLGHGALTISNGGTVSSATAIIGSSLTPDASAVAVQGSGSSWTNTTTLYVAGGQTGNNSRVPASLSLADRASLTTRSLVVASNSTSAAGSITLTSHATLAVSASANLGGISTPRGTATLSLTDSSATVGTTLKLWNTPNTSLSLTRSSLTIGTSAAPGTLDSAASISLADYSTLTLHGTLANTGTITLSPDSLLLWDPIATTAPLSTLRTQLATNHILPSPTAPTTYRPAYSFSGEPTAPTSVTVTLALTGDANLDGRINADDYALLDRAFAKASSDSNWTNGDFNYDGIIDNQDYLLIDTAYGQSQGLTPGFLSQRESQFGADYVSALLTSVPEPSSLACLFAGSLLLPRRRRR